VLPGGMQNLTLVDLAGVGVAVALVLLARFLLPAEEKKRARLPAIYLLIALVCAALWTVFGVERVFRFFYTFFLLASCGRSIVLLAVDVVFGRRIHRAPPRIFRDLTQAVVYVVVLLLTLREVGVEPGSLLTTSALITAVIGLALQDTMGNLVSGLALQMQRPFEVGDFIQFDPDARQIGQVTEVNWRATTVMTSDLVEVIVPNALLAKQPIRNFSRPSVVSRRMITVQGPYDASPRRVHDAIETALKGTPGVLADPPPWVQTRSFGDSGIEYAIYFFTNDFASRDRIDGYVRDRVWYAMQRAGVAIPFPTRTLHMHAVSEDSVQKERERELERRDRVLRCVDFLDLLPADTHRKLAARVAVKIYAPGEVIVAEGDRSGELFIIDAGEVAVELHREDRTVQVARLGVGKFFGEMGLMTGEPRKATVRAATECQLFVIDHESFHDTLASQPGLVEKLSDLLASRQAELDAVESSRRSIHEPIQDRSKRLISQIKDFFKL
jgi:small-conductance mechanosensitive channel